MEKEIEIKIEGIVKLRSKAHMKKAIYDLVVAERCDVGNHLSQQILRRTELNTEALIKAKELLADVAHALSGIA